jgi:hypothetical protein
MAANIRSFIEAVRRKAAVVYVGSVREMHLLTRTKFDIKARAVVSVSAVARGPATKPSQAIFANSFQSTVPPGYLLQGKREELLQRVKALRDNLSQMSSDQLKLNEINEEDRRIQLALYEKLGAYLRTP